MIEITARNIIAVYLALIVYDNARCMLTMTTSKRNACQRCRLQVCSNERDALLTPRESHKNTKPRHLASALEAEHGAVLTKMLRSVSEKGIFLCNCLEVLQRAADRSLSEAWLTIENAVHKRCWLTMTTRATLIARHCQQSR